MVRTPGPLRDMTSELQRRLYGVVAQLIREGIPMRPWHGIELVREFGPAARLADIEPSFEAISRLADEFERFARHRVAKLRRWQRLCPEPRKFHGSADAKVNQEQRRQLAEAIDCVMTSLADEDRAILRMYLTSDRRTEIVRVCGSTYAFLECVVGCLAAVAGLLEADTALGHEWRDALRELRHAQNHGTGDAVCPKEVPGEPGGLYLAFLDCLDESVRATVE